MYHVWKQSPNEGRPYGSKNTGAQSFATLLANIRLRDGDQIHVHGDCTGGQCVYRENVVFRVGVTVEGREWPIIDGGGAGAAVTFAPVVSYSVGSKIEKVEVRNGQATFGGGISVTNHYVEIRQNCIHHNEADDGGGGIGVVMGSNTSLCKVEQNHIHHNTAVRGGGVYLATTQRSWQASVVNENVIEHNTASFDGGALACLDVNATVTRNEIFRNEAKYGGGVACSAPASGATVVSLEGNDVRENIAEGGGGIRVRGGVETRFASNLFTLNRATIGDGGGLLAENSGWVNVSDRNSFDRNRARQDGGGLHALNAQVSLSTGNGFLKNVAGRDGGAVSVDGGQLSSSATVFIAENRASSRGGGIYAGRWTQQLSIDGAILQANRARRAGGAVCVLVRRPQWRLTVARCLITRNQSRGRFSGVWFGSAAGGRAATVHVSGCRIEDHAGVALGFSGLSRRLTVGAIGNRFGRNGTSVRAEQTSGSMENNAFRNDRQQHVYLRQTGLMIRRNLFSGGSPGAPPVTPTAVNIGRTLTRRSIALNAFERHGRWGIFGAFNNPIDAKYNWWGNRLGPRVPQGQQPPGADAVTRNVIWSPPIRDRRNLRLANPSGPSLQALGPPPAPNTRAVLRELFGGFDCGSRTRTGPRRSGKPRSGK